MSDAKKGFLAFYFKSNLLIKILLGLVLGAIFGIIFKMRTAHRAF